jgi:hypothetical protein
MEDAMLSIRIVTAGAILVMAVGGAAAQTATNTVPGKPIQLLPILTHADEAKTKIHAKRLSKTVAKTAHKTRIALARRKPIHSAESAKVTEPANIWPVQAAAVPTNLAAAEPALQPASASTELIPSELVVGGRTVQVVSPDDANEIDRAADAQGTQASTAAPRDIAEAKPQPDPVETAAAQRTVSEVGSASWIAQVLAALGGAVAAGSLAWFLIGSAPQRTYG